MYPFNKKDVENDVHYIVNSFSSLGKYTPGQVTDQVILMMSEINQYLFSKVKDIDFYSEYNYIKEKSGNTVCNFAKACSVENWELAKGIADDINRAILDNSLLYQGYVKSIKNSSEYIYIQRNNRLHNLLN